MFISIRTPLKDIEDIEKVKKAILNIFPDAEIFQEENYVIGKTSSLNTLFI